MKRTLLVLSLALASSLGLTVPLAAQDTDLGDPIGDGAEVETAFADADAERGGLTGSTTDESDWEDLGIAIPAFATDRNTPTAANADGTAALGREIARVITANLRNNGLFKPTGPDSLPSPSFPQITAPSWGSWSGRAWTRCLAQQRKP